MMVQPSVAATTEEGGDSHIQSVSLAVSILEQMAALKAPVGVSELARMMGLPKARIFRHLLTLKSHGLLVQDAVSERYRLGWALFRLGAAAAGQYDLAALAEPSMRRLRDACAMTVSLLLPDGDGLVVSHVLESEAMLYVTLRKGLRVPLYRSAAGRLMLAHMNDQACEAALGRYEPSSGSSALPSVIALRERLHQIRTRGYEHTEGEHAAGITSLAAPVMDRGSFIAAVVVNGTKSQISIPPQSPVVDALLVCAQTLSVAVSGQA